MEAELRGAYAREHRIAATLQRAFLAHDMPEIDGLSFDAIDRPAERDAEVGGDWYDAIVLDDGRVVVSIGDVAGHGLDAAVVMGNVRQAIRVVAQAVERDPVAILDAVDRSLRRDSPETIVTAFIGIVDPGTWTLAFASAGHPPPLMYADGLVSEVSGCGLPLGLREAGGDTVRTLALTRPSTLVLYTDGLIESTRDIEAGETRLREAIAMSDRAAPARPAKFIQERVLFDGIRDDVAVLTLTFRAK
jgi:serine phosphatase RsbU (regulator of sigma subunit)